MAVDGAFESVEPIAITLTLLFLVEASELGDERVEERLVSGG